MEKDISQRLTSRALLVADISTNTTTNSAVVDTQEIQTGLMFSIGATAFTDGVYAISFEKADDLAFTLNVTAIPADQIVDAIADITAATAAADALPKAGILSLKSVALQDSRYVRAVITSTGTTTGASLAVITTEMLDNAPS